MNETDQLKKVSDGLLWMSESDYPFEVFTWDTDTITPEQLKVRTGHSPDTPVEVKKLDEFFTPATTEEDWHNEEEKAQVKRYQAVIFLR